LGFAGDCETKSECVFCAYLPVGRQVASHDGFFSKIRKGRLLQEFPQKQSTFDAKFIKDKQKLIL
jgi:hypothetical protein